MFRLARGRNYQLGYTDDELENIIIRLNNEAMQNLQTGNLKQVHNNLQQANQMLDKMAKANTNRQRLKAFTLNGWACLLNQRRQNQEALKLIDEAIRLELQDIRDNLSLARSYLNKCVILSQMDDHDEALKLANQAIQCLENQKKHVGVSRKRRQKLSQLFVISFYNIAAEFQYMSLTDSATQAYKKGYQICRQLLGQKHQLSQLMRKNLKLTKVKNVRHISLSNQSPQEQKTISQMSHSNPKKRLKTIQVPSMYHSEIPRKLMFKRVSEDRREHSDRDLLTESKLMQRPQHFMQLKSIEQRLSKLGQRRLTQDSVDDTRVVARLKKIYMSDAESKMPKKKARKRIKTQKNSTIKQEIFQIQQPQHSGSRKNSANKQLPTSQTQRINISSVHNSPIRQTLPAIIQQPSPSVELPSIKQQQPKSKQCSLI